MIPNKAFILAAGHGTRLRPLTNDKPKPMVEVYGKPMIDHALDALEHIGVKECVINTHYKADILKNHLQNRTKPTITISHETDLLDTGGGINNAIAHFKDPFYILSGDSVWEDSPHENTLQLLPKTWDPERMDILMLLQPVNTMHLTKGVGDYTLDSDGRATRSLDKSGDMMFTSIRINAPHIFNNAPQTPFSYLEIMDQAQTTARLFGVVHKGAWHHISTPDDLSNVEAEKVKRHA